MNPNDGDEHWLFPTDNKTKININTAIFQVSNCYSFAFTAENQKSELIEVRSSCKQGHVQLESAEAMGIREVLIWIKGKESTNVLVEMKFLVPVEAIRGSVYAVILWQNYLVHGLVTEVTNKGVILRFVKGFANVLTLKLET